MNTATKPQDNPGNDIDTLSELAFDHVEAFLTAHYEDLSQEVSAALSYIIAFAYGPLVRDIYAGRYGVQVRAHAVQHAATLTKFGQHVERSGVEAVDWEEVDQTVRSNLALMLLGPLVSEARAGNGLLGAFGPLLKELRGILQCPA